MIKTIKLNGSEIKVTGLGGDNTEIVNNGSETIYASKLPNITAGGDDVISIPTGGIDGLYGTRGTVYLLGSGNVEVRGVDHKISKVRCSKIINGGGSITENYVDEKCSAVLDNANAYADAKDSEIVVSLKEYADGKGADTLSSAKCYTDSINAELAGFVGYTDSDIYGLEADFENNKFTRLAGAVGKNPGADFDEIRAFGGRRRCNVTNNGIVFAYYGDKNYQEDGFDTPSLTEIQCMVEQPKFYYKVVPIKIEKIEDADGYHLRKARYYISDTPKPGFKIHPAFVKNGVEMDKIYLSAYEGNIHIQFPSHHLWNDEQDQANFDVDQLCSVFGALPASGTTQALTRDNARKLAHNRGEGWEITTIQTLSATQLLFAIEYATFNSQEAIGSGVVNATAPIKTGSTSTLGNASGSVESGGVSYRGEENLWGNIWTWMDGVNSFNDTPISGYSRLYVADHDFADDTASAPYKDTGIRPCSTKGYVSAFGYSEEFDWMFISSECKGSSAVPVGDYFWNITSDWCTAISGAGCNADDGSGAFCCSLSYASSVRHWNVGARLVYFPTTAITPVSEEVT